MYGSGLTFPRALGFFKAYLIYPPLTEKCVGGGHQGLDVYKEILWSCARQSSTLVALGLTTYNFYQPQGWSTCAAGRGQGQGVESFSFLEKSYEKIIRKNLK